MRGNNTGAKARLKIAQLKEDSFRKLFKNTQLPTRRFSTLISLIAKYKKTVKSVMY